MTIPAPKHKPDEDFSELGNSLLKGDVLKIYYLMILTGVNPQHANQFLFNLRYSDQRAASILIRNTLINSLKQTLLKLVKDPILYQRARALANKNEFNVFEGIEKILKKQQLDEEVISDTLESLRSINKDMNLKKKLSEYFNSNLNETVLTSSAVVADSGNVIQPIAGLPPDEPPITRKGIIMMPMIKRRYNMVGNPAFTLTNEGYSKAINGTLPDEINEALKNTGIVVLENEETEKMMFLVQEACECEDCEDCDCECGRKSKKSKVKT